MMEMNSLSKNNYPGVKLDTQHLHEHILHNSSVFYIDTSGQSNIVSSSSMTETYKSFLSCTEAQKQYTCGVLITIILGALWVGFTQFSKNTYTESFTAPLIVVYFHTSWLVVFYPVYITVVFIVARGSIQLKQLYSENLKIYKEETKLVRFSVRTCAFCFIWAISNYSYIRALQLLDSVDVIALYSTNQSFVYMLSWIVLFEKFIAIRVRIYKSIHPSIHPSTDQSIQPFIHHSSICHSINLSIQPSVRPIESEGAWLSTLDIRITIGMS
eukprot:XP_014770057.1 PREDICTED: solute carrier family 35 member F4-like [Octopus bimaculoides]